MIKTAPRRTLSPQMWCIKKKIKDWFARTQIYWQEDYFLGVHIRLYQVDTKFVSFQNHLAFPSKVNVPLR